MDLSQYYTAICKYKMFNREEEFDMFLQYNDPGVPQKQKDKIRDDLIKSGMRFAFKTAKAYSRNDPNMFPELLLAANEGLVVGFDKFKFKSGNRLLSYSGFWLIQKILHAQSKFRIVSMPIYLQQVSN